MRIATIDFEASSFAGWPIEVGWMREDHENTRSMLIRPTPQWSKDEWDIDAEAIHKIRFEDLIRDGQDVLTIYNALLQDLAGYVVVSDAPGYDQRWLERLCLAAGRLTPFQIESPSIVLPEIADRAGVDIHDAVQRYLENSHKEGVHRAGPDAQQLMHALFDIR